MGPIEQRAAEAAQLWHGTQVRKYTGEPYWHHCREVANIVRTVTASEEILAAAWLHDTLEDTKYTLEQMIHDFGVNVATMVEGLTDHFTKDKYPDLNRRQRKSRECARLSVQSRDIKMIKLADLISNTRSIRQHDPAFAKVYLAEKRALLPVLREGSEFLWQQAAELIVCSD